MKGRWASDPLIRLEVDLLLLELHARGRSFAAIGRLVGLSATSVVRRLGAIPAGARREAAELIAADGPFLTDAAKDRLRSMISAEWRREERRQGLR